MANHPPRHDLENNPDFHADLLDDSMSRDAICEKWRASNGFVSSRRKKVRSEMSALTPGVETAALPPEGESSEVEEKADGKYFTFIRHRPVTLEDARELIRSTGDDPDLYWLAIKSIAYGGDRSSNKISAWPKVAGKDGIPSWPPIQPLRDPITITAIRPVTLIRKWGTAVIGADTQIGFDMDEAGALTPYHDEGAIGVFLQVVALENPDQTILAGDILDLTEQGRWAQEERFARTTQPALEYGRRFAAETRARTNGEIHWIEGNHDKRMQSFMEINAKASMGLRKAGYPDSWPVMSIPNLIGLDEFDTNYIDAYPAGVHWITDGLRVIHGTRANSKGSTAAQYANETPHISTVFGHTHRLEVQSKTTFDRAGKIRTMNINPGCLCRVDGMVPSVHGARHLDGTKATYWEDWQQGVSVIRYLDDGTFYVELVQIDDGRGFYRGQELIAA